MRWEFCLDTRTLMVFAGLHIAIVSCTRQTESEEAELVSRVSLASIVSITSLTGHENIQCMPSSNFLINS